ncbi:Alpha/Beta hydrolase protein [Cytidiella melzeri]|nr:Alpha/Beta hydrolase protein [Cytidiella melzeri]
MGWIDVWMNNAENKKVLGVPANLQFDSCNMEVNQAFFKQGDGMHNSAALLPDIINDDVKLLVYTGNADSMCNFMGNEAWVEKLEHKFHSEFVKSISTKWTTLGSGRVAGEVRFAGGNGFTAGNVTFVQVLEAGHMVPFDQPKAALDMFTRWITDVPLLVASTCRPSIASLDINRHADPARAAFIDIDIDRTSNYFANRMALCVH